MIDINPMAHDAGADIGLVLMVGTQNLDLEALLLDAGILDCHLGGYNGAGPADIGIKARHVAEHANLDGFILSLRRATGERDGKRGKRYVISHVEVLPLL